jgi:septum formation protein
MPPRLVLASASPARLATLRAAGIDPLVRVSDVDERALTETAAVTEASAIAKLLARAKAEAVAASDELPEAALVVGCDSVLEINGRAYGKPADAAEAIDRWQRMSGRHGTLHTGHHVVDVQSGRAVSGLASTTVRFAEVDDDEIEAYVATGEPLHVAGAFTIDGLGGAFIDGIEGDPHNVVGISLPLMRWLLHELGYRFIDFWSDCTVSGDL